MANEHHWRICVKLNGCAQLLHLAVERGGSLQGLEYAAAGSQSACHRPEFAGGSRTSVNQRDTKGRCTVFSQHGIRSLSTTSNRRNSGNDRGFVCLVLVGSRAPDTPLRYRGTPAS